MKALTFLKGIGLGAGFMYFFDPNRGAYRRGLVRDQVIRTGKQAAEAVDSTVSDLNNRMSGALAKADSIFDSGEVSDETLEARIRSRMGHVISHSRDVTVQVHYGRVTLRGSVPINEVDSLVDCVRRVRGVVGVENEVEIGVQTDFLDMKRHVPSSPWVSANGMPKTNLLLCLGGALMTLYGHKQKGLTAGAVGFIGMGLLVRGLTDARLQNERGRTGKTLGSILETENPTGPVELMAPWQAEHRSRSGRTY